jgi:hypothetical protein
VELQLPSDTVVAITLVSIPAEITVGETEILPISLLPELPETGRSSHPAALGALDVPNGTEQLIIPLRGDIIDAQYGETNAVVKHPLNVASPVVAVKVKDISC